MRRGRDEKEEKEEKEREEEERRRLIPAFGEPSRLDQGKKGRLDSVGGSNSTVSLTITTSLPPPSLPELSGIRVEETEG